MKKHCIVLSTLLLALALGPSQFAQDAPATQKPDTERYTEKRSAMFALVRTINTTEVSDYSQYGSFELWQTILERHGKDLNQWLTQFYSHDASVHFADAPEILPGWNLRLTVPSDGSGWVVMIEDTNDKNGFAALSDERGVIWECKPLQ